MAHRHSVTILDDLDGSEGASSIRFGLDDRWYSVDLSPENEKEFRELLRKYVDAAVDGPETPGPLSPGVRVARNTHDVRKWLWANNIQIGSRGRIPNVYLDMYDRRQVDEAYVGKV
jgi:hypothetical protein